MSWTDGVGGTDLDLYVTGAANSGSEGATSAPAETFVLQDVMGSLDIRVEPYLVTDVLDGTTYTLAASLTAETLDADGDGVIDAEYLPDSDGDGVADGADNCPERPNAGQADIDGDGKGDLCDSGMDGDGHSNGKEKAHGTDPADPSSYPRKRV